LHESRPPAAQGVLGPNPSSPALNDVSSHLHPMPERLANPPPPAALPDRIPVLAVRSTVVFPLGATALQIAFEPNVEALGSNPKPDLLVAIVWTEDDDPKLPLRSLEKVAVVARVLDRLNLPGGTVQATLQGLFRARLDDVEFEQGYYTAVPRLVTETPADEAEAARLIELILTLVGGVAAKIERINDEVPRILRLNVADPGRFADLAAALCHLNAGHRDEVLQRLDVTERLDYVLCRLQEAWNRIQEIEHEHEDAAASGAVEVERAGPNAAPRRERVAELRNRIRAMQAELGMIDPAERDAVDMLRRIDRDQLPARVAACARREAERLRSVSPGGSDATEIREYLETLLAIPWNRVAEPVEIELDRAREIVDERHIGIAEAKRRLLEILAVAKLRGDLKGPIPCIVGPPGVGRRSIARTLSLVLNRPMAEVDLGGRGETQLLGSRRTRPGAQAGKLLLALRDAGVRNPVYLLQDVDEIGLGKVEGDPIEALEEFLDPEHRAGFTDRYLDTPIDLTDVMFVGTATEFLRIPRSLREHFIEIRIAGYTPEEKVEVARRKYFPKQALAHGLQPEDIEVTSEALLFLTRGYARDAGLSNLRRAVASIMRYLASRKAAGETTRWTLTRELIEEVLGLPRYMSTPAESAPEVGVVTGLAWTASGGELMFIEALKMPGTGRLIITGLLGDVMRESVNAAYSYVRSRASALGIHTSAFSDSDIHIHFPVGATPKDGPSAGAAVTLAIGSSLAERPVRHDVAMTGEVTLRGRILEIGGVKEKTLAAYRAGIRDVVLPTGNEKDLRDVPSDVREGITFHFVDHMDEIFNLALLRAQPRSEKRRSASSSGSGTGPRPRVAAEPENEE
jgi:ATP-dependent Lon protease